MDILSFAKREGISLQRAAKLAREGRIPARKVGREWVVEPGAVLVRRSRRPLSVRSRDDFVKFLDTHTLDHVTGDRKRRTALRIREYWTSENPAALLRDWFPETVASGRGGIAIVKAAQSGEDDVVLEVRENHGRWILKGRDRIKGRVSDYAAIRGFTAEHIAAEANVGLDTVHSLMRRGYSVSNNLDAYRVVQALGIPTVQVDAMSQG